MFFRKRKLIRAVACFFLLETLSTLAAPTVSWAMMGPGQPEFTSYESSGSPDLVNLTTGDFTYNVPVIEVPGPERSFSMPLTYRAGIKLEQEASWVGLGWSLNAGAIARSVTGYPDDADGEVMQSTYQQKVTRGWTGGVPGVLELGWDVNTGHSGSASLLGLVGLGWSGGGVSSGSLVGVHASKEGITANPIEMVAAAVTIATLGSAGSLAAMAGSVATSIGYDVGGEVANSAASVLLGKSGSSGGGLGEPTVKQEKGFLHTNYWVFYNDQKTERMYGSLHFDDMSQQVKSGNEENPSPYIYHNNTSNLVGKSPEFDFKVNSGSYGRYSTGPGADLFLYNPPGTDKTPPPEFWNVNNNAISIAHDDFSVMGGSVSGNIRPYRLEVGSLAFPYQGTKQHNKFATIPYLNTYKVPFRYENSLSNGYDYHQFTPSSATTTDAVGAEGHWKAKFENGWTGGIVLKDPSLYDHEARTAPARKGIVNQYGDRKLVQGKNIKWFTNEEILQQYANSTDGNGSFLEANYPQGKNIPTPDIITGYTGCDQSDPNCQSEPIMEAQPPVWSNNPCRVTLPGKGVGAFAITAEDGTTYHYSLPVYHYTQYSASRQVEKPVDAEAPGVSTQTIGARSSHLTGGGYATTWLLTAITSSDYVDRGKLGTVDDSDWGGWIRFDYGKFSSTYKWRQPYVGENFGEKSFNDASFAEGYKETYYLNSIRTRSHTALFLKSVRNDARGHYQNTSSNLGLDERQPASSLRLDEVVLLTNDDLAKLQKEDGIRTEGTGGPVIPAFSNNTASNSTQYDGTELWAGDTYQNVLDQHDVDADARIREFIRSSFRNFLGDVYRSKVVPAYTLPLYGAMGPASANLANRNMLTQEAASYVYKVRANGDQAVVSASVQTWSSDWTTYRGYDAGADAYVDLADDPRPIWRLCQSYVWVSPQLNPDGTYANFTDFDWGRTPLASQAANWVKAGEFTRYDHYSKPLESRDINGQYVARKLGYNQGQRLVTAANARYAEVAYSGAEDVVDQGNGVTHFGGEVRDGGRRSTLQHHTGLYAAQLRAGETGFTYKAKLGSEVRGGQKYRLSCWIHQSDVSRQGQLYAQVDGRDLGTATIASGSTKQAGEWYLVTLLVDVPTDGQQLTVGCRAGAGAASPVFADDFRFQPLLAPTTAYVYDPTTAQLTYVLDNDNLFTHYEYDAAGKVARISKEVLTPAGSTQPAARRVKEYAYNFAQMTTPTWLPTGLLTWAQTTGQRQHEERDINPRSTTYGRTQNVDDGYLPTCHPGSAPVGQAITLKGANNQYVSSEEGKSPMLCNRLSAQGWEHFVVVNVGDGKVALMNQGKFVSSENGEKPITCNRPTIGAWEKFDWVKNTDGSVSLRGSNGRFISNENGAAMTCNRQQAYAYESFFIGN